jgi:hypothetical protein
MTPALEAAFRNIRNGKVGRHDSQINVIVTTGGRLHATGATARQADRLVVSR